MKSSTVRALLFGLSALLFVGCASNATNLNPPGSSFVPAGLTPKLGPGAARIVVRIPEGTQGTQYISPSTKSMMVVIYHGTTTVYSKKVDLTSSSPGCTNASPTTCLLTIHLPAASYTASVTTFDAMNGTGKRLSIAEGVAFAVVSGQSTLIPLTLNGVPAGIVVLNKGPNAVYVVARDADGNYILGHGSPTYSAARTSGSTVVAITQPNASHPNLIGFTATGTTGHETIGVTASFPTGANGCSPTLRGCENPGAISASYGQTLFVTSYSNNNVLGFTLPLVGSTQNAAYVLNAAAPMTIGLDASNDLFVGGYNHPGHLYEFEPPYASTPNVTNSTGISDPYGMTVDSSGAVYSANTTGTVSIFSAPYTAAPTVITSGVSVPYATALDASKNLYVVNDGNNTFTIYPPPYTTGSPVSVATASAPYSMKIVGTKLYVGEASAIEVFDVSVPLTQTSTPLATLTNGVSYVYAMALDTSGNLFASNYLGGSPAHYGTITKYAAPLASGEAPAFTLTQTSAGGATYSPWGIAFDAAGNLYVVNTNGGVGVTAGGIVEYLAPITAASAPAVSLATGQFNSPNNLAITGNGLTILP
jgi:hypothetical protein